MNLVDALRAGAAAGGWLDRPAYEVDGALLTHAEVYDGAARVAGALVREGVRPGDRVVLLLDDGTDLVLAFLGAVHAGAVAVPVNHRLHRDELRRALASARPALVVHRPGDEPPVTGCPVTTFAGLAGAEPAPVVPRADDDQVYATFTSGTTGVPRLCPQLHGDPVVHHRTFAVPALGLGPDDVVHSVSKTYFAYGLGNSLLFPLMSGSHVVLNPEPPRVDDVLAIVDKYDVTALFAVPTFYGRLVAHPGSERLAKLRVAATGGEVLSEALEGRLMGVLGDRLLNGIGTTEVGQAFTHNTPAARRVGTVGRALPPFEVRVVDDAGTPVEPDVVGRLQVRGPTVTLGLDEGGRPRRTRDWYATGDTASVDADGFVRVTGRLDDVENVGGIKLHPLEVEHLLAGHPLVREAAVCAVADDAGGPARLRAYVVRADAPAGEEPVGDDELAAALTALARAHLTAYKVPRSVVFVPSLPRTGSGKLRRHVVRGWRA
ncbi:AMP-binding protein [Saccharothrix longispora]|uniref:AMP-binding protein n=1 Tax=Saccharothrix longispora TaxID=33920 RepID=UPI0028FD4B4B|nr:AMP-binding protein [Saccharothrix longispora]MBY8848971.1 AMP-binding protein [Saccharothrix sp. MB29]MDU0287637.1 AMP-binding protein [Saccharothrix longispora]